MNGVRTGRAVGGAVAAAGLLLAAGAPVAAAATTPPSAAASPSASALAPADAALAARVAEPLRAHHLYLDPLISPAGYGGNRELATLRHTVATMPYPTYLVIAQALPAASTISQGTRLLDEIHRRVAARGLYVLVTADGSVGAEAWGVRTAYPTSGEPLSTVVAYDGDGFFLSPVPRGVTAEDTLTALRTGDAKRYRAQAKAADAARRKQLAHELHADSGTFSDGGTSDAQGAVAAAICLGLPLLLLAWRLWRVRRAHRLLARGGGAALATAGASGAGAPGGIGAVPGPRRHAAPRLRRGVRTGTDCGIATLSNRATDAVNELRRLAHAPGAPDDSASARLTAFAREAEQVSRQVLAQTPNEAHAAGVLELCRLGRAALDARQSAHRRNAGYLDKAPRAPFPPERPCFVNPLHGPGTERADADRLRKGVGPVPVCRACAERLAAGETPDPLLVWDLRLPRPRSYLVAAHVTAPWSACAFGATLRGEDWPRQLLNLAKKRFPAETPW